MPEDMNVLTSKDLFPAEITKEIFSAFKEDSVLAQLIPSVPIPYVGKTEWIMSLDGEASVVDEGAAKPAGSGLVEPHIIKPFKVVYQMRITDEFLKMADEQRLPHMEAFEDGFAKKLKRAFELVAFHGIDPASGEKLSTWNSCFDGSLIDTYLQVTDGKIDEALKKAISRVGSTYDVNGIIFTSAGAEMMGEITKNSGDARYPQFDFAFPAEFAGAKCVKSNTLEYEYTVNDPEIPDTPTPVERKDLALVGDFGAMRWGYAQDVTFDIITTGDPDGQGDLKRYNQIVLRAEAYVGYGILDPQAFALVGTQETV